MHPRQHPRPVAHAALAALAALTVPMAHAALSGTDASTRLAEANNLATQFQMPTTAIDTNNYGFRYSALWNPSTLPATSHTLHSGVDLNTTYDCGRQVLAVGNGIVRFTGHGGASWGGVILIQHRYWDSTAQSYREVASQYAHVAPLDSLREGDFVTAGQHIGYIADNTAGTCRSFAGVFNHAAYRVTWSPHLHFEMRTNLAHSATRWATAATYQGLSTCTSILYASATCRLNATNAAGYSNPEDWITAHANVVPPPPAAPVGLRTTAVALAGVTLAWTDNSSNETGFKVERKISPTGTWSRVATVAANTTTYTGSSIAADTSYYYRVKATNGVVDSAASNEVQARVPSTTPTVPAAPSGLNAAAGSSTLTARLDWQDNSNNETGFTVEARAGAGNWALIASLPASTSSLTTGTLLASTAYSFRVRASNAAGASAYSAAASYTTPTPLQPPAAPTDLAGSAASKTSIRISWTDRSSNESSFTVERRLGLGGWSVVAILGANTGSHTDTGLLAGRSYSYRVKADNSAGSSGYAVSAAISTPR